MNLKKSRFEDRIKKFRYPKPNNAGKYSSDRMSRSKNTTRFPTFSIIVIIENPGLLNSGLLHRVGPSTTFSSARWTNDPPISDADEEFYVNCQHASTCLTSGCEWTFSAFHFLRWRQLDVGKRPW